MRGERAGLCFWIALLAGISMGFRILRTNRLQPGMSCLFLLLFLKAWLHHQTLTQEVFSLQWVAFA